MYKKILVPIDLADPDLAKPAVDTALMMAAPSEGTIRLINVLPLTPVMLAEYVPPDFEVQQKKAAEDALAIMGSEIGLEPTRVSTIVRQGGIYQEILEEAAASGADLIVMTSHGAQLRERPHPDQHHGNRAEPANQSRRHGAQPGCNSTGAKFPERPGGSGEHRIHGENAAKHFIRRAQLNERLADDDTDRVCGTVD